MGVRRYSCFLFQIGIVAYILGAAFYLLGRNTNISVTSANKKYDPNYNEQPRSYVIDPPNYPFKMKVDLPVATNSTKRQAAAFIVLVRNSELFGMVQSMQDVEQTFNHKFNYPWIFLNEEPFTEEFINATKSVASSKTHYGLVDESMWGYPDWIDQTHASNMRDQMRDLPYGSSESYRHMCRFQSGFFWRHPLVLSLKLEYYWRVEPDVRYFCDLDYDPFLYMKQNNKKYEHGGTIPTLWNNVKQFAKDSTANGKIYFKNAYKDSMFNFLSDNEGDGYNGCHFWTNFEIARIDLWHSEAYQEFFKALDATGGFFYERWGDAPVHSIFAALYLKKDELHFFNDIGYKHNFTDNMSCLVEYMTARDFNPADEKRTVNDILIK
ncbi:glycolipid 2-alpha-mannosyltransferase-domain-containing protein [Pilaira anomala]|nr:glycolipid 2-alpha-mannosyltransferase-domain-containing protein [Pilaira anomala]